jgi:hypothetical protein
MLYYFTVTDSSASSKYSAEPPCFKSQFSNPITRTRMQIIYYILGWVVRLYHSMTEDEFQYLNFVTQSHVDFCNATKIIQNRKLGDLFTMKRRWVNKILNSLLSHLPPPPPPKKKL